MYIQITPLAAWRYPVLLIVNQAEAGDTTIETDDLPFVISCQQEATVSICSVTTNSCVNILFIKYICAKRVFKEYIKN